MSEHERRPPTDFDAMFRSLESAIAEDRGPLGILRSQSFGVRLSTLITFAVVVVAVSFVLFAHVDTRITSAARLALDLLLGLFAIAALGTAALWPLHRPPLSGRTFLLLEVVAALAAVALVGVHIGPSVDQGASGLAICASRAFGTGALAWFVVQLLSRGADHARVATAVTGALIANLTLHITCPDDGLAHILVAHASVLPAFFVLASTWERRRRQQRSSRA